MIYPNGHNLFYFILLIFKKGVCDRGQDTT